MIKTYKLFLYLVEKKTLLVVGIIFSLSILLLIPKIYLRNNIYYVSKDINELYSHYISLKEENKFLNQQLEAAKFKNDITDSLLLEKSSFK